MNSIKHKRYCNRQRQLGLSLVELMVAVTISLILMAGVGQIFLSTKVSYNVQNGLGRLQENARYALDILSRNISMAGYKPDLPPITNAFDNTNSLDNATENADLGFTQANGKASDTIQISYTSASDCLGNASGGVATDRYYLNGDDLMCLGNGSGTPGIIAEGIENMQILYGEDTDGDGTANVYVSAGNITDWNNIKTVRLALLVSTVDSTGAGNIDNNTHVLLDAPPIGPIGDNMLRRVFSSTIKVRNR